MTTVTTAATARALHSVAVDRLRDEFPSLASKTVFLENAGGSQVPRRVADAIRNYMLESYVQLGAGYRESEIATRTVADAHGFINLIMNGESEGKVVLGPSSTQLTYMLASCYADVLRDGDEIIVAENGHEANIGPWMRLAERKPGVRIRVWPVNREMQSCLIEDLKPLLGERTRIVAFPHVSNLLGEIADVESITRLVHEAGARVVVDGVAFAPHRAIDVSAWGVDWYVYSTYKVYGPHMGALFGRSDAFAELTGPNHCFIAQDDVPYKYELGGASHEGCAGLLALRGYLNLVAGRSDAEHTTRMIVVEAFGRMTACELPLQRRLIDWLGSRKDVRIVGPHHGDESRVATISFLHERLSPREIVAAAHARNIGIRFGHMYAHRLCTALGIDTTQGVVRVSAVHYNTVAEIDRLIEALEPAMNGQARR